MAAHSNTLKTVDWLARGGRRLGHGNLALPVEVLNLANVLDVSAVADVNALPSPCFHAIGAALRMEDTTP